MSSSIETRFVSPPIISSGHIGRKVVCIRPGRTAGPRIERETISGKIVIHNYGHGGNGWTLAPESATRALGELHAAGTTSGLEKTPIAVLGGGIVGLMTALKLIEVGQRHVTIYADDFDEGPSHRAGGLFLPRGPDPLLRDLSVLSYQFYQTVCRGAHPVLTGGVHQLPLYTLDEISHFEPLIATGMAPPRNVRLDFGNGTSREVVSYDEALFFEVGAIIRSLHAVLEPRTALVQRRVSDIRSLDEPIVFNCAGLGSLVLAGDASMNPTRGHLVFLTNQPTGVNRYLFLGANTDYRTPDGRCVTDSTYYFPKSLPGAPTQDMGVLGGTYVEGDHRRDTCIDDEIEFDKIVERARVFFGC